MRSWGQNSCIMEAVSLCEDVDSGLGWNQPQFCFDLASKWPRFSPQKDPRSGHDRAMIGPRSRSWSVVDCSPIDWRRLRHVNSLIAARSRRDRGSIGPRSWNSYTKSLNRPMGSSWMNDHDSPIPCAAITMRVLCQPSNRDRLSMKISRPIAINSRPSIDADWELLRMPPGARYIVRLSSLMSPFCARDGFDDRVDSGLRDRSRLDCIRRPISCHASCTGKTVWEHSPTRRK